MERGLRSRMNSSDDLDEFKASFSEGFLYQKGKDKGKTVWEEGDIHQGIEA